GRRVVAVGDADEMRRFMPHTLDWPGPIYIRLAKGFDPIVSRAELGFTIGKAIPMRVAAAGRGHVLMVSTGVMTTRALEAAKTLAGGGVDCTVFHMHTGKPLDIEGPLHHVQGASLLPTPGEDSVNRGAAAAACGGPP